jgi:LysM domain
LASPALAAALAIVLIALLATIVLFPGLLPGTTPSPSPRATPSRTPTPTAAAGESPTAVPSPTFVRPTPTPEPTFTSYIVRPGESLNTIAHAFNTSARSLAWWNRGTYPNLDPESATYDPNHIEPGWILVLIPGTKVDDNNPPTPSPGPPTPVPTVGPSATPA